MKKLLYILLFLPFVASAQIDTANYLTKPSPTSWRTDTNFTNLATLNISTHQANFISKATLKTYFASASAVTSVFGRTGAVTASSGDYSAFYPSLSGSYSNPSWLASLAYSKLTGAPTNVSQFTNDAGYITSVSITAGNGIQITGSGTSGSPYVISTVAPTIATTARTLNSNFTVSTTKSAFVFYTISASTTNPLLVGSSTATCFLEYSQNGGSTWTAAGSLGSASAVGVTVTLQLQQTNQGQVAGVIPANALVRLRTTTTGTASVTFVSSQEITY